jgi:chemotaxis signal transduction protein
MNESIKVIVFPIANYLFALPMTAILKVSHCPPLVGENLSEIGLVHLENRTITLLNLHQKLTAARQSLAGKKFKKVPETSGQFLILTQASRGEVCGIPIDKLPDMMDLPLGTIELLPESYQQTNLLGLANYVAVLQSEEKKLAIFLLDLEQALNLATINAHNFLRGTETRLLIGE